MMLKLFNGTFSVRCIFGVMSLFFVGTVNPLVKYFVCDLLAEPVELKKIVGVIDLSFSSSTSFT